MNRIITANIHSFVFQIDEAAYDNLKAYLNKIRQKVNNDEVVSDIENRIAELFDYKLRNGSQAIFQVDVDDIIAQIGNPEQFGNDDAEQTDTSTSAAETQGARRRGYRRLYRNEDDKIVGGVCSGIAAYFDIDPLVPRIIFAAALFFFGSGFLLYIFLMIILPKAITPSEKLEMRGEPVDYKNLSKTIEKDFKDAYDRYSPGVRTGFERSTSVIVKIGTIILMALLVSIFIPGCIGILGSIGALSWSLPVLNSYMFTSYTESITIIIGVILFLLVPVIGIGYKLIRVIFKTRPVPRIVSIFMVVLWITGFCLLAYSTFNIGKEFSSTYKITTSDTCTQISNNKTLIIRTNQSHDHSEFTIRKENGEQHINIRSRQDMKEFLDEKIGENINLKVIKGIGDKPVVKISKRSAGKDRYTAAQNAQRIDYNYTVRDSIIYLDDFFSLGSQQLWRNQKVLVTIEVPEGYHLFIDHSCNRIFDDSYFITSNNYYDDDEVTGRYLKVEGNGILVPEK
jgi:phage shock protein PspC (stress-responsive transcriptional regulator)